MIFNGDQYADDWKWWLDTHLPVLKESNQRNFWKIWHKVVKTSPIEIMPCHMFEYFDAALSSGLTANAYSGFRKPYRFVFKSAEDRLSFTAELQIVLRANMMPIGYINTGEHF